MKKKLLKLSTPIGLLIAGVYLIINRFVVQIPEPVAYPMMMISIFLMMIGTVSNSFKTKKQFMTKKNKF